MYKRYPAHRNAGNATKSARGPAHGEAPRRRRRRMPLVAIAACVGACLVATAIAIAGLEASSSAKTDDGWYDAAATAGAYEGKSEDAVRAELEKQVAEGMMNISIASDIQASATTGEAEVRIENIPTNSVDQKVTLARADTGEVLYESDAVAPGSHIQTVQLDPMPEPGRYGVLATFTGYDRETHEQSGTSAAEITLTVEA